MDKFDVDRLDLMATSCEVELAVKSAIVGNIVQLKLIELSCTI